MSIDPNIARRADEELANCYQNFTLEELRWDWCCNISQRSREIIQQELDRRKTSMKTFNALRHGRRRE